MSDPWASLIVSTELITGSKAWLSCLLPINGASLRAVSQWTQRLQDINLLTLNEDFKCSRQRYPIAVLKDNKKIGLIWRTKTLADYTGQLNVPYSAEHCRKQMYVRVLCTQWHHRCEVLSAEKLYSKYL